jgi:8-oxo-dGTP diphosphatase
MMIRNVSLIVLFDKDNRILLQHRTNDAPTSPRLWGFFGGGIKDNETPEDAVRREAFEELEFKSKKPKLILTRDYSNEKSNGKKYYFIEKCLDKDSLNLHEGQGMSWFSFAEAKKLKMSDFGMGGLIELEKIFKKI